MKPSTDSGAPKGYNQLHMTPLYDILNKVYLEAVIRQPEEGIHAYRVNFKMATALCREYFRSEGADYEKLLEEIGRHIVPVRPDRQNKGT